MPALSHLPLRLLATAAFVLAGLMAAPRADAQDRIWAGLVIASDAKSPKPPPVELGQAAAKIAKIFGYNQVELVGTAAKEFDEESEHWLVPSQHFWMSVKSKHAFEEGYLLQVSLYHDKRQVVEMQAKVAPVAPLIIRGPVHARGQLIFVLQLQK